MAESDEKYMQQALDLAIQGRGKVNPNPLVGAVVVADGNVVGRGFHEKFGEAHAEVKALTEAGEKARDATLYVNLEPCSHYGKTPPCALTIIKSGISKVVAAIKDPNPLVSGKGIECLREAGIEVVTGICDAKALELNRVFIKFIQTEKPYVILKAAMTLDGKITASNGQPGKISSKQASDYVHALRNEFKGIMVGVNTVILDDPILTTRMESSARRNPVRIVVDSKGRIPLNARLLADGRSNPVIIASTYLFSEQKKFKLEALGHQVISLPDINGRVDLQALMVVLGSQNIDGILLEGGGILNEAALKAGIVDEVQILINPVLVGGNQAVTPIEGVGFGTVENAIKLKKIELSRIGGDILIKGKIVYK
jgi:diaminohydroxyphosphoribosylaminopyrimidine deaminase/5-amino-6-(5-phosphoribosylamino)uracil reductase